MNCVLILQVPWNWAPIFFIICTDCYQCLKQAISAKCGGSVYDVERYPPATELRPATHFKQAKQQLDNNLQLLLT